MTASPQVSIVIVNWNTRDQLLRCLASISGHPPERSWDVYVIDNGSTDGSVAAVETSANGVRVIANGTNRGLPAANNQGLVASRGDYVLISNPDVVYRAGTIDRLCGALDRHPRAAFAVPQLVQADGRRQTSAGSLPRLSEALIGGWFHRRATTPTSGFWWHEWDHADERSIEHGAEASYLVRRSAVVEIGPQDEGFPLDWEGIDWSARAGSAGWEIRFVPDAIVEHEGGASVRQAQSRWIVTSHLGMFRYFRKRRAPTAVPGLAAVIGVRCLAKLVLHRLGFQHYRRAHQRAAIRA